MRRKDGKEGEATGPGHEPESLLAELPLAGERRGSTLAWRAPSPRAKLLLLLALLALASSVAVARLAITALAASSGPLSWSAPELIDHQYPYADPSGFAGLSCISASLCVGDTGGQIVSSTDPTGTSPSDWSVLPTTLLTQSSTGYSLAGISCVSTAGSGQFCATTGHNNTPEVADPGGILTSTNPTGGAAAWQTAPFDIYSFTTPSCAQGGPTTLCVAAGMSIGGTSEPGPTLYASENPGGGAGAWKAIPITTAEDAELLAPSCPSTKLCVEVASNGQTFTSTEPTIASSWHAGTNTGLESVTSLSCPTTTFCLAYGAGRIETTTNPGSENENWTEPPASGFTSTESDISCFADSALPSPSALCLAGVAGEPSGDPGKVLISPDGGKTWLLKSLTSYSGVPLAFSCVSGSLCLSGTGSGAVVNSPNAAQGSSSSWSAPVSAAPGISSLGELACSSPSLCVGADGAGNVLTSTNPSGGAGAWSAAVNIDSPNNFLNSLACAPSSSLCAATDLAGNILTSTDPGGGAGAWSAPVKIDTNGLDSLLCPSASLCLASDFSSDILYSTDPTGGAGTWSKPESIDTNGIGSLACVPSSTLCLLADNDGYILYSSNPAGGLSSWSTPVKIDTTGFRSLSCPSASLCVAIDYSGDVLYSTDPTGGAWSKPESIDTNGLEALTCAPSTSQCVATEAVGVSEGVLSPPGNIRYTGNPAGGASAWSAPASIDTSLIQPLSCPSASLCLAGDVLGNVLAGTIPGSPLSPTPVASQNPSAPGPAKTKPLPPPVLYKDVNVVPVSGTVYIKLPPGATLSSAHTAGVSRATSSALKKGIGFIPLTQARQIPVDSILDTTRGTVSVTAASTKPGTDYYADFSAGIFKLLQNRQQKGLTELDLMDTLSHKTVCASVGKGTKAAVAKHLSSKVLGQLISTDNGKFSTRGAYSSATVRGTAYGVKDMCAGTLTRVKRGVVVVDYFRRHKSIVVRTGQSFLAKASGGPSVVVSIGKRRS